MQSQFFVVWYRKINPIILGMVFNPVNDASFIPSSIEFHRFITFVFSVPEQSWISLDLDFFHLVQSAIEISQNYVGV